MALLQAVAGLAATVPRAVQSAANAALGSSTALGRRAAEAVRRPPSRPVWSADGRAQIYVRGLGGEGTGAVASVAPIQEG